MRALYSILLATVVGACAARQSDVSAGSRDSLPATGATVRARALPRAGDDSDVTRIRAHFAQIERERPGYRCRTIALDGFSAEGGELDACYAGHQLRKLTAVYLGESGRAREEYYFWNDSLEFLFSAVSRYSAQLSGKVVSTDEDRFYWHGSRLVRWLDAHHREQALNTPEAARQDSGARASALTLARCAANLADSVCAPPD